MRRKLLFVVLAILVIALGLASHQVAALTFVPPATEAATGRADACAQHALAFDASSIEAIYLHPEEILVDPGAFWASDPAYRIASEHHRAHSTSLSLADWQRQVERLVSMPVEQREDRQALRVARKLLAGQDAFCERIVPHVGSFLPEGTDLSTTIYLTALADVYAPNWHPYIAVDVSHSSHILATGLLSLPAQVLRRSDQPWADLIAVGSASTVYNTLAHELFHIGFCNTVYMRSEVELGNYPLQWALTSLQNEGLAVYTAYTAERIYPAPLETDNRACEGVAGTQRLLAKLNQLLASAESLPEDELMQRAIAVGKGQKAFHKVGCYMAHTIDDRLGRDALVDTLVHGPRSFIRAYNSVADERARVHELDAPGTVSPFQRLRQLALEEDDAALRSLLDQLGETAPSPSGTVYEALSGTGQLLLHQGQAGLAAKVFQLAVTVFPEHAPSYLGLGHAYAALGERALAIDSLKRALELDPGRLAAAEALETLKAQ